MWGGGCTPIGDRKKGKESGNLKTVSVFQLLLAGIGDIFIENGIVLGYMFLINCFCMPPFGLTKYYSSK